MAESARFVRRRRPVPPSGSSVHGLLSGLLRGAAAGAAGTTALDAATYLDMVLRGRAASSTPERSIEASAERMGIAIPGEGPTRDNRVTGLGALSGIATGVSIGALLGGVRALGLRPGLRVGSLLAAGVALVGANVPMAAMGVTDPRRWSATDWVSDLLPHLAYGVVTHATLAATDRVRSRPPAR